MKHKDKITKNKKIKKQKKLKKKHKNNTQLKKDIENNIPSNNNQTEIKTFLGKKRKLIYYKRHSLQYNELNRLYNPDELSLNINNFDTMINLNPNFIKGRFAGLLENEQNDNDLILELNNPDNPKYNRYTVYDTKKFKPKLTFLELSSGILYLLFKGYAAFVINDAIKIYHFSKNNTCYDIYQRITLPDELQDSVLFLFKFVYDDDFYFFNKVFSLKKDNKILLYKYNKKEKENENDFAIMGRPFVEYIYLELNFEFIWFAQKNNCELLFFYEDNFNFIIYVYDISKMQVVNQKTIKLNNLNYVKIANYSDKVIDNKYLPLSNHNLLYFIDTNQCQISAIKELDVIEYFKLCDDNTLWTIESTKYKNSKNDIFYLRQYKIIKDTQELVKVGERKIYKTSFITDNIALINNKKILLFKKGKKLILFK